MSAPQPQAPPSSGPSAARRANRGCDEVCRTATRSAVGCVTAVLLTLGYAALGGALFMLIENKAANMIRQAPV